MNEKYVKVERIKRLIDRVAYLSLFLDMCIAIITSLSIFKIGNPESFLIPINYMLTIVVMLSIGLFIALFILKYEENILNKLVNRRYSYKPKKRSLFFLHK